MFERKKESKGYRLYVFGEQGWRCIKSTAFLQCGLGSSPVVNALCVGLLFVDTRFPRLPKIFRFYKKNIL